jgi:hypothetical protein
MRSTLRYAIASLYLMSILVSEDAVTHSYMLYGLLLVGTVLRIRDNIIYLRLGATDIVDSG